MSIPEQGRTRGTLENEFAGQGREMNGTPSPPINATVRDRLAEEDADRAHARRFFWRWLIAATALTLLGNAGHALLPADNLPTAVRLGVALTPPIIALIAIHAVTVLARVGSGHRANGSAKWTFRAAACATVLLAISAAAISFNGLYTLAIDTGHPKALAVLFPVGIDAGIALATLAIYFLRPASAADLRAAHEEAERERIERERAEDAERIRQQDERNRLEDERIARAMEMEARALAAAERAQAQVSDIDRVNDRSGDGHGLDHVNGSVIGHTTEPVNGYERPMPERMITVVNGHSSGHDGHMTEARELIGRTGKRSDPATVAEVLRRLDADVPVAQISSELGMGERTIRQIRDARQVDEYAA